MRKRQYFFTEWKTDFCSTLSFPQMYLALVNAPWFKWDPGLLAELTALLTNCQETQLSQVLLETHHEKLNSKQLLELKCALILHYARNHLKTEMLATFKSVELSSDSHVRVSAFSSLIQAYACMDLPHDAYTTLIDMQTHGFKPYSKDLKAVLFSFGRCALFDNMERVTSDMEKMGSLKDPVVFNMIINTYATVENHSKIKEWIDKMLASGVKPTVRSLNAVAKACPVLTKLSTRNTYVPIAMLFEYLETNCATQGEIKSVEYLVKLCLVQEAVKWDTSWQLDLHSTVVGSAYVMLLCWLKEVLGRLDTRVEFPSEIVIVTGWGKHSETRGSSLIKLMVRDLLENMGSPFMVDSQNKGRLFAKSHAVLTWLRRL